MISFQIKMEKGRDYMPTQAILVQNYHIIIYYSGLLEDIRASLIVTQPTSTHVSTNQYHFHL